MPLSSGLNIHDDTKHKGSAKRGAASGIAPLDAGSKVPSANLPDILPSGCILMWHGLIANIPTGYVICDGNSSTPNLQSKFLRGAPPATEAGTTGGADTHTLVAAELPEHHHSSPRQNASWYASGSSGSHSSQGLCNSANPNAPIGGDLPHNNMPAYYEILYIMKT